MIDELNLDPSRGQGPQPGVLGGAPAALVASATGGLTAPGRGPAASDSADASWWSMLGDLKDRTLAGYDKKLGKPSVNDQQVLGRDAGVGQLHGIGEGGAVARSRLVRVTVVRPRGQDGARGQRDCADLHGHEHGAQDWNRRSTPAISLKTRSR